MTTDEPRGSRALWVLPTAVLVAAASVAGGFLARDLYTRPATFAVTDVTTSVSSSTATSVPRSEQPGDRAVRLSVDAELHPDGERVRSLVQRYYDAINAHDHQAWTENVTTEKARRLPAPEWEANYQTTTDGSVVVHRIDASSNGRLRVLISFVSTQDVSKSPAELPADCIRWRVVSPMTEEDGTLRVDIGPEDNTSQFEAC